MLKAGALGVSAQGWKICRAEDYDIRVPADWSCSQDQASSQIVSVSLKEKIQFVGSSSRRVKAGERFPTDSARLKEYLSERFDLINSAEDGQFAVTTKNIAAEPINGLRGVVAELTLAKPAVRKDGTPILIRLAGFALVAERGSTRYSALILCPLERFTYNSAVMNRVINDIGITDYAESAERKEPDLDGVWHLSDAEGKYQMFLHIKGGSGTLTVSWRDKKGEAFVVQQRIIIYRESYGVLAVGSNPTYVTGNSTRLSYAADTLLFQRQLDGSWKVWARDDVYVKRWTPLQASLQTSSGHLPR
jgi:hypothetical protein